jgi:uncharacterized protein DUF4193
LARLRPGIFRALPSVQSGGPTRGEWTASEAQMEDEEEFLTDAEEDDEEEVAEAGAEPEEEGEASLDEILAKKPEERVAADEEDDDESILTLGREDRIETLSVKVEPKKDTEFVCKNCHLVKPIRSQLKDKVRMFCRDCA